jgi:hypothetical protein
MLHHTGHVFKVVLFFTRLSIRRGAAESGGTAAFPRIGSQEVDKEAI